MAGFTESSPFRPTVWTLIATRNLSSIRGTGTPGDGRSPLRLANLLNDADTLARLLVGEVEGGDWLNAFLLGAGIGQVLEDALHTDPLALDRIAVRLADGAEGGVRRGAAATAVRARAAVWTVRGRQLSLSALASCSREVAELTIELAGLLCGAPPPSGNGGQDLQLRAVRIERALGGLPRRVRSTPLRLPSGFLHLDMRPEDVQALIEEVAQRWPERERPVLVVGVRTTGSYLAPLGVACLRARGRAQVRQLTMRPGQRWLPEEQRTLAWAAAADALVLVMDDPPKTWATVAKVARALSREGIKRQSIVPVMPTFPTTASPPPSLSAHPVVLMPWEQAQILRRLHPEAVKAALQGLLGEEALVRAVERLPFDPHRGARAHVAGLFEVQLSLDDQRPATRRVYVHGVGLGYFGTHALTLRDELQEFVPRVYGVVDGLMFRDWLPEELRITGEEPPEAVAGPLVDYVLARARALPVAADVSSRLRVRPSLWRAVGRFLSQPFGRFQVICWPLFEVGTRKLLQVSSPSVIDGKTGLSSWFRESPSDRGLRKVGFAYGAFSPFDTYCYDPVFDLAGIAASSESEALQDRLLELYSAQTGEPVDPERWLLYQLVHLTNNDIEAEVRDPEVERRMSSRLQRYFSALLLADVRPASRGKLCAIDIDGVLESNPLGVSAPGLQGARSLRALHAHGYRPVIVSGRSLPEVRDRCLHYGAAGGVAEYGAAIYVTEGDRTYDLLTPGDRDLLDSVRSALESQPDVVVDRAYRQAVRAYRPDPGRQRRVLSDKQVRAALAHLDPGEVRAIHGQTQTDFMVRRVSKATGLEALAAQLGIDPTGSDWLAMAIGDSASDLPFMALAESAYAPANADTEVRQAGVTVLKGPFQAGLLEATARLLGHRPGHCQICRDPDLEPRSRLLLTLLSPPEQPSAPAKAAWAALAIARLAWHLRTPDSGAKGGSSSPMRSGSRVGGRNQRQ